MVFWRQAMALLVAAASVAMSLAYSSRQVERLREETRRFTRSYAELISFVATDTTASSTQLDIAFSQLIAQYDFPYVVTDTFGTPLAWRGVGVETDSVNASTLARIAARVRVFDRQFEPIPLEVPGAAQIFHYGDPPSVRRLRVLPFIQLGLLALVLLLVWWSLRAGLARQRSLVWVGVARESAHQFGTPLSSLQGWMRLLSERLVPPPAAAADRGPTEPAVEEIVAAMEEDVERLVRVTSRFAKIGSPASAEPVDLVGVAKRVVGYMRGRAPQRAAAVTFIEDYESPPLVRGQEELLEWVVENLLKNSLDALGGRPGEIRVRATASVDGRHAVLRVEDTGGGIAPADQRRIFDAGFSRKRRGWGLGLALARRLVEGYGGRLRLVKSRPGQGSVFEAVLPAAGEPIAREPAAPPPGEAEADKVDR